MTRRLPILRDRTDDSFLDDIQIATPCSADWNQMNGDARVRHCSECRLNVYNLSEMTRKEAATLLLSNEGGKTCVRLYRRPDGTLLTQDCWARLRAARQRGWLAFGAALLIVCLTQLGLRVAGLRWLMSWYNDRPAVTTTVEPVSTPIAVPMMGAPPPMVPPPVVEDPRGHATMGEPPMIATPKITPRPTMGGVGKRPPALMGKVRPTEL